MHLVTRLTATRLTANTLLAAYLVTQRAGSPDVSLAPPVRKLSLLPLLLSSSWYEVCSATAGQRGSEESESQAALSGPCRLGEAPSWT